MSYFKYLDKQVYYEEHGEGMPLILLHGNTASSKMFMPLLNLYKTHFKVILIDFLGHGNSERLAYFQTDFWYDEAMQVISLIQQKQYQDVSIIGVSGGAIAAINAGLERPDLISKIIADSFAGEHSDESLAQAIEADRENAKNISQMTEFWRYNHGADWRQVIDNDTAMIKEHSEKQKAFFHKPLEQLSVPILFTASSEDELIVEAEKVILSLAKKVKKGASYLFKTGTHPAMVSNAAEFSEKAKAFLME